MSDQILRQLYNVFDPLRPLKPGDSAYVDCRAVRGDGDILEQLGRPIILSDKETAQLYTGHRGAGKSTELLRLKEYLEENKFQVIYFAADDQDIDTEDAQYTDILLACTRYILSELYEKDKEADAKPLVEWLKKRWESLKDLGSTEISFENISLQVGIGQFAKVIALLRSAPSNRSRIRQEVDNHTPSLIECLNDFITEAAQNRKTQCNGIVLIADNLDRIVPLYHKESNRSNHEEIFIDRNLQLRKLKCHTIYTVPISLVYSDKGTVLEEAFGSVQALPMIALSTPEGEPYPPGMEKLKELIKQRIKQVDSNLTFQDVFTNEALLEKLCNMSGGHVRYLMFLMKTALQKTPKLPIQEKAVLGAIASLRLTYRRAINEDEWSILAEVHQSKRKPNNKKYQKLLFNRCILEYHWLVEGDIKPWYDIHPIILAIEEFQQAWQQLKS